jgi:hypothetical protein
MTPYRSELDGIRAGMALIGVLARSRCINIIAVQLVCDDEAAVKRCNQKLTSSIYHNTESDRGLLKTFHSLQYEWCKEIPPKVHWVKWHADRGDRALTPDEWLNIEADLLADKIREEARGPYGARPNCSHWPVEKTTLFIQGAKVTRGMKKQLASQLSDGKLKDYIIEKEKWTQYTFNSVAWRDYQIAFKRLSKNRQVNISKACFNLWHTGRENGRYYGGKKYCCMCNAPEEDWIHILTCPSIDTCMNREESWAKARKSIAHWKVPNDFWTAMETVLHGYTWAPKGGAIATPFPPADNNRRNHLKLSFREQDTIGWDNLIKGILGRQWIEYVKHHIHHDDIKLKATDWATKMIQASWDQLLRL